MRAPMATPSQMASGFGLVTATGEVEAALAGTPGEVIGVGLRGWTQLPRRSRRNGRGLRFFFARNREHEPHRRRHEQGRLGGNPNRAPTVLPLRDDPHASGCRLEEQG